MEVARRLTVLEQQPRVLRHMGALRGEKKHRKLALTSIGSNRCVVTAPRRTAFAYRQCAAGMPGLRPAAARTHKF